MFYCIVFTQLWGFLIYFYHVWFFRFSQSLIKYTLPSTRNIKISSIISLIYIFSDFQVSDLMKKSREKSSLVQVFFSEALSRGLQKLYGWAHFNLLCLPYCCLTSIDYLIYLIFNGKFFLHLKYEWTKVIQTSWEKWASLHDSRPQKIEK